MLTHDLTNGIQKRQGAYLPHWTTPDGVYFVTFRLAGSLPKGLLESLQGEREDIVETARSMKRARTQSEENSLEDLYFRLLDLSRFDQGNRFLEQQECAKIVTDALEHFDGQRYRLYAWTVMPNHIHVVFRPLATCHLSQILHSWKSFTANACNKFLGRTGAFWQAESYDHWVRGSEDLVRCIEYTWQNPEKAGLTSWQWKWRMSDDCLEKELQSLYG